MDMKKLFLVIVIIEMGHTAQVPNDTLLAIPFLFPHHLHDNCSQKYPKGGTQEYRFFLTAQTYNTSDIYDAFTMHSACGDHPQATYKDSVEERAIDWFFESGDEHCTDPKTLCYQCKNGVFGLIINFAENPTISMVAHLLGDDFDQSFAINPMLSHRDQKKDASSNTTYTYKIMFGVPRHNVSGVVLDGIVIHVIYNNTDVTIHSSGDAIALKNAKEYVSFKENENVQLKNLCHYEVIWIEPKVNSCQTANELGARLQLTVIESKKPIMVFTNHVMCNKPGGFSFESQLVHQIPPVSRWETRFIIDIQHSRILPAQLATSLIYTISMLSSQNDTSISVRYYHFKLVDGNHYQTTFENYSVYANDSRVYIQKREEFMKTVTHIDIQANHPILLIYNVHTDERIFNESKGVYYSILVQPVQWFSNVQTVALSKKRSHTGPLSYHISVVIPKAHYNPNNIVISKEHSFESGTSLANYGGFNGKALLSNDYVVLFLEPQQYKNRNHTYLLLWHRDPTVDIGATVLAYSPQQHYGYSNGYILENAPKDLSRLQLKPSTPDVKVIAIGILSALLILVTIVMVTACYCRKRGTKSKFNVRDDEQALITQEPGTDYEFDVFILFADEDECFVRTQIYIPLYNQGYKILWKYDPSHNLFHPGSDIVTDLANAMLLSRKAIVVCTKYYDEREHSAREVSFCKDVQKSEQTRKVIPVVVEDEYSSDCFKQYNQIRVTSRDTMSTNDLVAQDVLKRLTQSLGEPIKPSTMESLL